MAALLAKCVSQTGVSSVLAQSGSSHAPYRAPLRLSKLIHGGAMIVPEITCLRYSHCQMQRVFLVDPLLQYGAVHSSEASRRPLISPRIRHSQEVWSFAWRKTGRCFASNDVIPDDDEVPEENGFPSPDPKSTWPILQRWNVPWDGKVTALGMLAWLFSFVTTGIVVAVVGAKFGFGRRQLMDADAQALFVFIYQLVEAITIGYVSAETAAGLGSINLVLKQYRPLPAELFLFDWSSPFDFRRGWLIYGAAGVPVAAGAVLLASSLTTLVSGEPAPREESDALQQLLPIIGTSPASTASLIVVTGVLAPLLEETVFRGFLMTSLTKWIPTPVAVLVSAGAFAEAHLTPGEFPQLLALGVVLGLSYAQTRNLLTPILIHAVWNSGVVVLLTLLRLQGYDIQELI